MAKPGMTQQLIWFEYCEQCRAAGEIPYQLTQFKMHYRAHVAKTRATMPPKHQQYVQWNGERFRAWAAKIGPQTATVVEILKSGQDIAREASPSPVAPSEFGFTRGADYYKGGNLPRDP